MFAVAAVVAFFLALIEDMSHSDWGPVFTVSTLVIAGLLLLALHMASPLAIGIRNRNR